MIDRKVAKELLHVRDWLDRWPFDCQVEASHEHPMVSHVAGR